MHKVFFVFLISTYFSAIAAASIPTVVVGNWTIPTGIAATTIPINVTGGDPVDGISFIAEISQGGIFQATGGPQFASIDLTTGTIWEQNQHPPAAQFSVRTGDTTVLNVAATGGPPVYTPISGPAIKTKGSFLVTTGTVNASGLLGTLVVSTVGALPGVYDLRMVGMVTTFGGGANSSFHFASGTGTSSFTNGTITVVPEPSSLALAAFGFTALAVWGWRRKQSRAIC